MEERGNDINYLEISRKALRRNAAEITRYVKCPIIGVVKCDGYGVSIFEAAMAWKSCGVTMFAVAEPQEALELRAFGITDDILLLSPTADPAVLYQLLDAGVILTVTSLENARFYAAYAGGRTVRAHIAVDTGMGRFGIRWSDIEQMETLYTLPGFRFEGIFSHFSAAFEKQYKLTKKQLRRFLRASDALTHSGFEVGIRHIANSCAALRFPDTRLDAVRIGSALIGELCADVPITLHPAGIFKAQVVDRKSFLRGDTTGYASVCKVRRDADAIVVAIGHESGFGILNSPANLRLRDLAVYFYRAARGCLHRPYIMYGDKRLYLIGRVGSQYSLFDATGVDIRPGEYVSSKARMLFPNQRRKFI